MKIRFLFFITMLLPCSCHTGENVAATGYCSASQGPVTATSAATDVVQCNDGAQCVMVQTPGGQFPSDGSSNGSGPWHCLKQSGTCSASDGGTTM